ncbi:MAG: ComEC/Rec2 family competence protein, partial [Oscillospiraceae bacterium]|nr:ComEC/Rec2 family competence protein [Oscillospiraceae bacterium]
MRPLCIAAFAVAAAMAIAHWALPFGTAHIAASVALVCGLIVFTCSRIRRSRFLKALTLAALALALGFAWRWGWDSLFVSPALAWDARTAAVEAEALATAQATDYGARVAARLTMPDGRKYSATLYLRENLDIRPGDKMALDVACKAPQPGSADDILAFWRPSGIVLRAVQSGGALSVDSPSPVPVAHWPAIVADTVRRELNRALPPQEAALAQGLLIGDSSALDESFLADLGNTGMTHAMSVSGMHISFLVGAIILLMGNRKRAFWVGLPVVFLFVAAAGFPASAVRAGIMQACLLFSYVLGREEDSLTALSLSLLVLLALNPYAVADAGLQLSFASSLGIILFSGRFRKSLASCRFWPEKRLPRLRAYVFSSISLSLSVLAFSAPLVAVYFQTFSLIAPVANLLAMWLLSFLFLGSIALVCFSLIFAPLAAAAA